jgi:hypothetical protein
MDLTRRTHLLVRLDCCECVMRLDYCECDEKGIA